MRRAFVLFVVGLLTPGISSAQESTCRVEKPLAVRVIVCNEDPAAIDEAIPRAQVSCGDILAEDQASCYDAISRSFALRREAMVRRALRAGWGTDAILSRYGSSPEEIARIEAGMAPRTTEVDPDAQARAAEELRAVEQELEEWRLGQDSD